MNIFVPTPGHIGVKLRPHLPTRRRRDTDTSNRRWNASASCHRRVGRFGRTADGRRQL